MLVKGDTQYLLGGRIPVFPKFKSIVNSWKLLLNFSYPLYCFLDQLKSPVNTTVYRNETLL